MTKRKRLRAMTYREFCKNFNGYCKECPFDGDYNCIKKIDYPCKPYGKYIFIEVKE